MKTEGVTLIAMQAAGVRGYRGLLMAVPHRLARLWRICAILPYMHRNQEHPCQAMNFGEDPRVVMTNL